MNLHYFSLRLKLLIVSLGMIGIFLILLFQYTTATYQALIERANQRLLSAAISTADSIEQFNLNNLNLVESLASHPVIHRYIEKQEAGEPNEDERQQIKELLSIFINTQWNQYHSMSIGILDTKGVNLLDVDYLRENHDESEEDYFQMAMLIGDRYISPVLFSRDMGGVNLYYSAPIMQDGLGRLSGVVRIEYSLAALQNILKENRGDGGEASFAMIIDEPTHLFLAHDKQPDFVFRSPTRWNPQQFETVQFANKVPTLSFDEVFIDLPDLETGLSKFNKNTPFFKANICPEESCLTRFAIERLETQQWFLIFGQPEEVFIAPVRERTISSFILSVAILVGLMSVIITMNIRWMTQPLGRLTYMANQIAEGNFLARVEINTDDEFGILGKTFNEMAAQLQNVVDVLETQVKERTAELKSEILQHQQAEEKIVELRMEHKRIEMLSNFITNVSHEFKHPLSIINTNLYLIERVNDPEKQKDYLSQIRHESDSILRLVDTLLVMSKLNSDYEFVLDRVDLNMEIRAVFKRVSAAFAAKNVLFKHALAADLPKIKGDVKLLHMVLTNILDNALRYTNQGGAVTIRTHYIDQQVVMIIRDSGMGIEQDHLPHVFKTFYRGDEARSTRGLGLGLAIVKRTIDLHNGSIDVQSVINEGTTITIKFPALHVKQPVFA